MKQILIGNGRVVTRDPSAPYFADGCVAVEDNRIVEVGEAAAVRSKYPEAEWVDAHGGVIMPGLVCTHNHIYSAFARGLTIKGYNPKGFLDILEGQWWKIDRLLSLEDVEMSAKVTYVDCILNGTTTVFDHHASYGAIEGSLFKIADVAKELGVRSCLCYEVSDRDGRLNMEAAVKENEDFILHAQNDPSGMIKGMMGLHAPFTLGDETLEYCAKHTPAGAGYHVHVAEAMDDVYDSLKKYSKRCVERLYDCRILGPLTIAAHCVHIDPHEMDLLKETDTMVVHNPESNMGNAVGCGPVLKMVQMGILMGLGTDGYTNDMFESYKVANILHKHCLADPTAAWSEIPKMLFTNNPLIAGRYFNKRVGVLEAGAAADIIVTDYDPDTPMDAGNENSHILFGMNGRSVITTIVDGRVLMKDRDVLVADVNEIMARSRETAARLWKRINS